MFDPTTSLRFLAFSALVAACGGVVAPPPGEGAPASSSTPTPSVPGGSTSPTPGTTTGPGVTVNSAACPLTLPAATDGAIVSSAVSQIDAYALGRDYIYWKTSYSDLTPSCAGTIYRTPIDGGGSVLVSGASNVTALAASGDELYWVADGFVRASAETVLSGSTGTSVSLFQTDHGVVAADATMLFLAGPTALTPLAARPVAMGEALAYDGTNVFTTNDRAVVAVGGDGVATLANGADSRSIAADDTYVYYASGSPPAMGISRVSKRAPGVPEALVPPGNDLIGGLLLAGPFLFFTVQNEIRQLLVSTKEVTSFAVLDTPPLDLAHDGRRLYFRLDAHEQHGEISGPGGLIEARAWLPE